MITTETQVLHCSKCDHIWREQTLANVVISVWTAHLKSIRCPGCGAAWKKLNFVCNEEAVRAAVEERKAKAAPPPPG